MESKIIEYGIDRAKYHGGDLEGTSIVRMFQNSNEIFNQFKISITKFISEEVQKKEVNDIIERYIEICTLFDTSFSLSRTICGEITGEIIVKLGIIIQKVMLCWRNLRFSSKMSKIHGIEDHLLDQIIKYNRIGCFIEDFIEQAHQYGMLEERKSANMRDREKTTHDHSKMEMIRNNGKVINEIIEVKRNTRRVIKKRKSIDAKTIKKERKKHVKSVMKIQLKIMKL